MCRIFKQYLLKDAVEFSHGLIFNSQGQVPYMKDISGNEGLDRDENRHEKSVHYKTESLRDLACNAKTEALGRIIWVMRT